MFNPETLYAGIDPGQNGGIVIVKPGDTTPVFQARLAKFVENFALLRTVLRSYRWDDVRGGIKLLALEQIPKGHPGQRGVNSALTMGLNHGHIQGMLIALDVPFVCPAPKEWQKTVFHADLEEDETKAKSIATAKALYPGINLRPGQCRVDHDGISDAACLAKYAEVVDE